MLFRICHCEGDIDTPLIAPCYCAGSLRFVHQVCLQQWIKSSNIRCCELCKFQFIMQTKTKPFSQVNLYYTNHLLHFHTKYNLFVVGTFRNVWHGT